MKVIPLNDILHIGASEQNFLTKPFVCTDDVSNQARPIH